MVNALLLSLITAFIIIGAHIVTNWEGMLLYWVKDWFDGLIDFLESDVQPYEVGYDQTPTGFSKALKYIFKPIFTCPYCMSSLWTISVTYIYTGHITWYIIPSMLLTCGIVTVLWGVVQFMKSE